MDGGTSEVWDVTACLWLGCIGKHGLGRGQSARVWKVVRRGGTHCSDSQTHRGWLHALDLQAGGVSSVHAGWGRMCLGEVGSLGHNAGGIDVKDVLKQRPGQ